MGKGRERRGGAVRYMLYNLVITPMRSRFMVAEGYEFLWSGAVNKAEIAASFSFVVCMYCRKAVLCHQPRI